MASHEIWKRRLGPLFGGAVALASSSAIPWPGVAEDDESPAAGWLLAVGAAIGLCGYAVAALGLQLGLPSSASASLALVAAILLGGAVVERGFGAYLARATSESAIVTTAVAGSLLVRAELLAAIDPARWLWAFPATWLIGRWAAMFLQAVGDPILDPPPRSLVSAPPPAWVMVAATGVVAATTAAVLGWVMLLALGLAAVITFAIGLTAQRKRGGIDAAVVSAAALAGELVTLLVLAAA